MERKQKRWRSWGICLILSLIPFLHFGQDFDKSTLPPSNDLPTDYPGNFDLVLSRTLVLSPDGNDDPTAPLNSVSSGDYFVGAGFKTFFAKNNLGLRFAPGFAWTVLAYEQQATKTFPSSRTDFIVEKQRMTFIELPVGLIANITKDEDGDSQFFLEAGGYIGYLIGSSYKTRETNSLDQEVKSRTKDIRDLEKLRYGLYGRVGYKWLALSVNYRMSEVFQEFMTDGLGEPTTEKIPLMPRYSVGLAIFF